MMKTIALVLTAFSLVHSAGLAVVEADIRELLPLDGSFTVYFVEEDWFVAESSHPLGFSIAESAEGVYLAHLSLRSADIPGTVIYSRGDVVLFRPTSPLPLRAHRGIRHIAPLRPYSPGAFSEPVPPPFSRDPGLIQEIIDQLHEDSLKSHIQHLEDYVTRLCVTPQFFQSALWVADKFESYGLESVSVDTFDFTFYGNTYQSANVHGELPGTLDEPGIVLITAHLDAITFTNPYEIAPGADDNASGCATVIEAARIFSQYEFPNTVRFVAFGAEELGLIGSAIYAEEAANAGENIVAVMNLDMILFGPESNRALFVPFDAQSTYIAAMFGQAAETFVPELAVNVMYSPGTTYSDHASFWQNGFPALLGIEAAVNQNPYYHQETDLLINYEEYWPFGTECARASLAFTAQAALSDWLGIAGQPPALPVLAAAPNPAFGTVRVTFDGAPASMVAVYDLAGRRVLEGTGQALDVSGLARGVYLIRAAGEAGFQSTRIVVAR